MRFKILLSTRPSNIANLKWYLFVNEIFYWLVLRADINQQFNASQKSKI